MRNWCNPVGKLNSALRKRKHYTPRQRAEIFEADRIPGTNYAKCRYGWHLVHKDSAWVVAHEIPFSKFGPNAKWNVGVSCRPHNAQAGDKPMSIAESFSLRTILGIILAVVIAAAILLTLSSYASAAPAGPEPPNPNQCATARAVKRNGGYATDARS